MDKRITLLALILFAAALLIDSCASPAPSDGTAPTAPAPTPATPQPPVPPITQPVISVGTQIGNLAPDFQLETLDGQSVSLSGLKGNPVLLNFWATWCPPCKFEMPFLQQVHDSWSDKGLVLLTIDIGESPATVQEFMNKLNLTMMVPMDIERKVAKDYGITVIPTTFFIDRNGIIRQKVAGAFPNKEAIEYELNKIIP